jgi:NTE family protein
LYDPTPVISLLEKYVDFAALRTSPVRLLLNAVNVETAELETFDSFIDPIGPEHLLASGSLPPGFPWTTVQGKHYWDGGIVSNSPLDQVVERCGLSDKSVYIVNLYPSKKSLPRNFAEVLSRRDEIVYAEKVRREVRNKELLENYRQLVADLLSQLDTATAERMMRRPLYLDTIGHTAPIAMTRFVHHGEPGEGSSKDYEFSAETVEHHIALGYKTALRELDRPVRARDQARQQTSAASRAVTEGRAK